jgi:catechol 2,3-dioxygenase-like lactoylglutathione lyase family enzyme
MRLRGAMIYVKDLPRMRLFYRDVVGLGITHESGTDYVEFDAGTVKFALHATPGHIANGIDIASPPRPRENNPVKLSFEADDVASERRRLEALGVTFVERPWGGCDGVDPRGISLEFTHPPGRCSL